MPRDDPPRLLPHHVDDLRSRSGLADATMADAGLFSVTDGAAARGFLNWRSDGDPPPVPALAIPYCGPEPYIRLRPDSPRVDDKGRPIKYESPIGRSQRLYIPGSARAALAAPGTEILITEGEKKALASCQAGVPAIAAGGVYGFHDATARREANSRGEDHWQGIPDLSVLANHPVTLVFDSDVDVKPQVMRALAVAIRLITGFAQAVSVAFLDSAPDGAKVGLDDLYVRLGRDARAFADTITRARRPTRPAELLSWLGMRWSGWTESQQETELRRTLGLYIHLLSADELRHWKQQAQTTLRLNRGYLKRLESEYRRSLRRRPESNAKWMTADGFTVSAEGVYQCPPNEDGNPRRIATAPVNIVEVGRDEEGIHHCTIRYGYGADILSVTVPRVHVVGQELLKLAARGAPVTLGNRVALQEFLVRQEAENLDSIPRVEIFTRFGWSRDQRHYVLGKHVIGGGGSRAIVDADERFLEALNPRGSLAAYVDLCRTVSDASPAAEAAWAVGYAPPLLRLLHLRSLLLSFWGDSHGGKSAGQALAVSAWGRPANLMLTGDLTPTALEANLARCRDLITWVDDTQQTRSRVLLDGLAYQVGGGTGRARGNVDGSLRRIANWLSIGFVSGEHPILKFGAAAGARNRTLELKVTPMTRALAAQTHAALDHHHGLTGPAFIEELIARFILPDKVADLQTLYDGFVSNLSTGPADQAGQYIGLIALADYLARLFILGDCDTDARGRALAMGRGLISLAQEQRDTGVDPVEAGYETIIAWVVENDLCFRPEPSSASEVSVRPPPRRLGLYLDPRETSGRRVVAIFSSPLREVMEKAGFNLDEVLYGLLGRGRLIPGETIEGGNRRLGRKTQISGKRVRAYWIVLPENDDPGSGGAPRLLRNPGPLGGPANRQEVPSVVGSGPAVPPVPAEGPCQRDSAASDVEDHAREFSPGTGGTVGQTGISQEEREALASTSGSTLTVPPSVPLAAAWGQAAGANASEGSLITSAAEADLACQRLASSPVIFIVLWSYLATTGHHPDVVPVDESERLAPVTTRVRSIVLAGVDGRVFVFDLLALGAMPASLSSLLSDDQFDFVGYDMLPIARAVRRAFGVEIPNPVSLRAGALLIGGYLDQHVEDNPYTLSRLAEHFLGMSVTTSAPWSAWAIAELPPAPLEDAARAVAVLNPLYRSLALETDRLGVGMAWGIENQIIPVVVDMEAVGFGVDRSALQALLTQAGEDARAAQARARSAFGVPGLNLNSMGQVNARLRSIAGFELERNSFDCLQSHASRFPALLDVLEYRRASARVKCAERYLAAVDADGRIRGRFDPLRAPAGRFGCDHPAMLNIPREPEFRRCFMASPGNLLIDADLKAAQLRIIADHTQDPGLLRAFCAHAPEDPHARTASILLRVPIERVAPDQRQLGKGINFGVSFGERGPGLQAFVRSEYGITLTRQQAEEFRRDFLEHHPGIRVWQESLERQEGTEMAPRSGSGRYRLLLGREARASKFAPSFAQAVEADGLKVAIAIMHPRLRVIGWRIIHIMHDEVIGEGPAEIAREAQEIIASAMKQGLGFFVRTLPIEVDVEVSERWGS